MTKAKLKSKPKSRSAREPNRGEGVKEHSKGLTDSQVRLMREVADAERKTGNWVRESTPKSRSKPKIQPLRELPATPEPLPDVVENTILRGPENVANDEHNVREAVWLFVVVAVLVFGVWAMGTPTFYDWPWLVE